jgi:hypothetical protein
MPGSRLAIVEGAGHFLPFEEPAAFLDALVPFLEETEPADATEERFHEVLLRHAPELALAPGVMARELADAGEVEEVEPWTA